MADRAVRVLLVDDDRDDYLLTRDLIDEIPGGGYTLDWAPDYDAGLAAIVRCEHDVYLLDYRLGLRDGLELMREALHAGCKAPIIFVTGQSEFELDVAAMQQGAADYLVKGEINAPILERSIRYALQQKQYADELERRVAERTEELQRANKELRDEIFERKRAEEALRISRERLDLVVTSTGLGLWYCDLPFDRLAWNTQCKEHFGLRPDIEVTIDIFYERLHPEDREHTRQAIERSISERVKYDVEYRTVAPDGTERWVRAIGRCFYDTAGTPRRFDGVTVDVTRQKQTEAALQEADRRKDEFLAMLAHELRNPLAPIKNALHMLRLRGPERRVVVRRAHELMERQVEHLVRLVDDLLDVSRITRGKIRLEKEHVDVAAIVARAVESSRPLIDARRHTLEIVQAQERMIVEGDAVRLAQILLNLLNNAAKYTHEGGRIWLTVAVEHDAVIFRVRDSGMGIPAEMLPHVFDLFTQVDRSLDRAEGGLGVGLTLVRRLVELHGGTVAAQSAGPGKGSEFVVRIPRVRNATPTALPAPARMELHNGTDGGQRILVVDDNQDAAESMAVLLRLFGNEVRTASDGKAALEAASVFHPELVLLDIGLPGMDGYEVCRRLREQAGASQPVVAALTGYGQDDDRRRSQEAGFNAHLVKPVDLNALQTLLARPAPEPP